MTTDLPSFEASLADAAPPPGLARPLLALWHAGRGEWELAHETVQADEGDPGCDWVHAHLHRVEGDAGNARYWYRRAGRAEAAGDQRREWRAIVAELLAVPTGPGAGARG